jgi:hypothetical protein
VEWLFVGALVGVMAFFHWARRLFWIFSVLVLPGTFAHESCHFLLGLLLNGRPASFSLMPRRAEKGWVMGFVTISNLRWYNMFFIGMAPLLLLPLAWWLMRWRLSLVPVLGWQEGVAVYLIANLVYAAVPSWQDVKIAARSPIGWLLLAAGAAWLYLAVQKARIRTVSCPLPLELNENLEAVAMAYRRAMAVAGVRVSYRTALKV